MVWLGVGLVVLAVQWGRRRAARNSCRRGRGASWNAPVGAGVAARAALSYAADTLARMALNTSAEAPLPVGEVSRLIGGWIDRLGAVWVEGQITQLSRRPGAGVVFLTLRDPSYDISVSVTCFRQVFDAVADVVAEGARVVVLAKPEWYAPRGQLSLRAVEIRPVGIGELLARLEQLKRTLGAEGLFAVDRKKPLPFLPHLVGPGLRAGVGGRARRPGERAAALARRPLRGAQCRGAGRARGAAGRPGGQGAGRRSPTWT